MTLVYPPGGGVGKAKRPPRPRGGMNRMLAIVVHVSVIMLSTVPKQRTYLE
jgi:hypothetical protein